MNTSINHESTTSQKLKVMGRHNTTVNAHVSRVLWNLQHEGSGRERDKARAVDTLRVRINY